MVLNLGLSACEMSTLAAAFGQPHRIRRRTRILGLDHNPILDATTHFLDGQVNIDHGGSPSRSQTLALYDPRREIGIDEENPANGIVSPKYLLATSRGLYVDKLSRWVDIPTGMLWLTKPDREGDVLSLEAQGKEAIALYPVAKQIQFSATAKKTDVIRTIMEAVRETRFRIEPSSAKMGRAFVLDITMKPWEACKKIAESMGRQLFYDALGYVVCRVKPASAVYTFRCGVGGTLRSDPKFGYTDGEVFNEVRATGGTPTGKNAPIVKKARVPRSHPLYITRDDEFVPLTYDATNDKLVTADAVQVFADDTLDQVVLDSQTATWDSSPVWHLEQGDPVRLTDAIDDKGTDATFSKTVTWRQASIPLTLGNQSNGTMRRVSRTKRTI